MDMIVADVPIGVLYILAVASLGVYGVVMAGWSSGSKYAFLGGLRGSAQMVSYEVGLSLSLVPVLMLAGDVRVPEIVTLQQHYPGDTTTLGVWLVAPLLVGTFLFYLTGLAETNRLPFDLPEAEAELVGGYHTEYSSMKFAVFMMGEYGHLITTAMLVTVFFFGGWDIPFWSGDNIRVAADGSLIGEPAWWKTLLTLIAFVIKGALVFTTFIWVRWTLPRFRYDQLMDLGWKFIIEFVTIYIIIIAVSVYALDRAGLEFGPAYASRPAGRERHRGRAPLLPVRPRAAHPGRGPGGGARGTAATPGLRDARRGSRPWLALWARGPRRRPRRMTHSEGGG